MTNERNNLCFIRSFIHSDDADAYFTDSMSILDEGQYEVTEANIDLINEKWVVRILAVPRQGELFD